MTRVAIYARYSSDLQRESSIEDQIRICNERAEREGWQVVECYTDYEISGDALLTQRKGMQNLLTDIETQKFDIVLSEALDRISRDQEHTAYIYKQTQFYGVRMFTLSEGEINEMHIGLKGTMNALFLKELANKVRRGQRGIVEQGKVGGGLCYGYDVVKRFDEQGQLVRGERSINEDHARVIRRIFKEYAAGISPIEIAKRLNADGVPGPVGKAWGPSTINGNWHRGSGILNNELYIGVITWNKVSYPKNPNTGKPVTRNNPPEEWVRKAAPDLRIIDQEVWDKTKERQNKLRREMPNFWDRQRPKKLLSYLLKCGCCGGGVSKISQKSYGCSSARNKGPAICDNRRTIKQDVLESTVLQILQKHLMNPKLVEVFCDEYTKRINELRSEYNASIISFKSELETLARKEERIVQAIMDGYASAALKAQMDQISERKNELQELLNQDKGMPNVILHPSMASQYHKEVTNLISALEDKEHRAEATELIRSLIDKIVLTPDPDNNGVLIDLYGDLAGILNIAKGNKKDSYTEHEIKTIRLFTGMEDSKLVPQDKVVGGASHQLDLCNFHKQDKLVGNQAHHFPFCPTRRHR